MVSAELVLLLVLEPPGEVALPRLLLASLVVELVLLLVPLLVPVWSLVPP